MQILDAGCQLSFLKRGLKLGVRFEGKLQDESTWCRIGYVEEDGYESVFWVADQGTEQDEPTEGAWVDDGWILNADDVRALIGR